MEPSGSHAGQRGQERGGGGGLHQSPGAAAGIHPLTLQPGHQLHQPGGTQVSGKQRRQRSRAETSLSSRRVQIRTLTNSDSELLYTDCFFLSRPPKCVYFCLHREAASNFLTALSLQRKSQSRQQSHQVMSGNIWAALRIALSMMDQPELFQAANIGDLDHLMRAFNMEM